MKRIGACFIGALGSISVTTMIGALAIRKSLSDSTGMITATKPFDGLDLVPIDQIEFFGFDVRQERLINAARRTMEQLSCINPDIVRLVETELEKIEPFIHPGISLNCGEAIDRLSSVHKQNRMTLRQTTDYIQTTLNQFKQTRNIDDLIVINLASTEPLLDLKSCHADLSLLEKSIDDNRCDAFRASSLYAYAAIKSKCAYINFTPSNGALFPAMIELARQNGVPVMGNDGKTGETLVKSALAPMFKCRNLEVMSWEGFNILGNMDGQVLNHPDNRESKIRTKDAVLPGILGYAPHSRVHINYVPSLADQKTAWDFIHFKGFLGARMSLQFIWQGFDSILAAPLILDLLRMAELGLRRGESGLMPHLASYFKAPLDVEQHGFADQFSLLSDYVSKANSTPDCEGS